MVTEATESSSETTCFYISGPDFQRIPLYELEKLREKSINSLIQLQFAANRKYGVSMELLSEY